MTLTSPAPWSDTSRLLLRGLDALLVGLVALAVLMADGDRRLVTALAAAVLIGLYGWGRLRIRVHERPIADRGTRWWPEGVWLVALTLAWVAMLAASADALWVAFALMLLQLHVLGPRWGSAAVGVMVVITVLHAGWRGDLTVGAVLGPAVGGLVAIGFVCGLEAIVTESQARQQALLALESARADLAQAERERVAAGERERLARDIHDTLAQGFSAIELLLRAATDRIGDDDDRARTLVDQARAAAQDNLAEARQVVRALAPPDLSGSNLRAALTRVAERNSHHATVVAVEVDGVPRALDVQVETALLRLVQSALANVTQHAQARTATVRLTFAPQSVAVAVADDGIGFDVQATPVSASGFGLPMMRSRIADLGGQVQVRSDAEGTIVTATIPIAEER